MESNARATSAAVKSLVRRGDEALAQQDWDVAADYYDRALDADERNAVLYLKLFLAHHHLLNVDELQGVAKQIVDETPAKRSNLADVLLAEHADGQSVDADVLRVLHLSLPELPKNDAASAKDGATDSKPNAADGPMSGEAPSTDQGNGTTSAEEAPAVESPSDGSSSDAAKQGKPLPTANGEESPSAVASQVDDSASLAVANDLSDPAVPASAEQVAAVQQTTMHVDDSSLPNGSSSNVSSGQAMADDAVSAHPAPRSPYAERLSNLRLSREAFERTFEDDYWRAAYERGGLEQRRHMERARADADAVLDAAFADERALLRTMCERAKVRVPRIVRITTSARESCDQALSDFRRDSGQRRDEVAHEFSYLGNNLRTAQATLWVGIALVIVSVVLLGLAIIPRGSSVENNTFAAFPEYFVPLGIVVGLVGVALLVLRSLLVRSNRKVMSEQQASTGATTSSILHDSNELDARVAAVRSRCLSLEGFALDAPDQEFESACADLDAAVKALGR